MPPTDILLRSKLRKGKELIAARRFEEARLVYEQICARSRTDAESWFTLGVINGMLKRHEAAAECCSKAVHLSPRHAAAWYNLGIALRDMGRLDEAAEGLRRALALDPRNQEAATSLGHVLIALHRYEDAEAVFRDITRYQPGNAEFYVVYGSAMQTMGRYEAAIAAYQKAIDKRHPRAAEVHENMAAALCLQGRYSESIEHYDAALKIEPNNARIYSNLLLTLHYESGHDPVSLLSRHRTWPGNRLFAGVASDRYAVGKSRKEGGKLRLGYLSSDLRKHSVAFFVEPLLAHHDRARFEVSCYCSHKDEDATSERLRRLVHRWHNVSGLNDDELRRRIAEDGIDILIDLNGHTAGNRLTVFARRAAPVQVSFIGYPDTTGVGQMDYRFSDSLADPPGAERLCTEVLWRLPGCFLCYQPPEHAPPVAPAPCGANGYVTFGSFNNLAKVNTDVVALWGELLRRVPGSRLLLKNPSLSDAAARERYLALFSRAGVSAERLDLVGFISDDASHLGAYSRIDVALDTFPYSGTTTTCEALWMGVPVVSLSGDRHSARVGASLLTAAGCAEWIATTPERYLGIAERLAEDSPRLAEMRGKLRDRVRGSGLCAGPEYTRAVERAYEEMYARGLGTRITPL